MKYFWRIVALPLVLIASGVFGLFAVIGWCGDKLIEGVKFWTDLGDA